MKILTFQPIVALPEREFRSIPKEMSLTNPPYPVVDPMPLEHPQAISTTIEVGFLPKEPRNGSNLASGCLPR
jgi:hypothetical protein